MSPRRALALLSLLPILAPLVATTGACMGPTLVEPGVGTIHGEITGLSLACDAGPAVARSFPPTTELKLAASGLACDALQISDRLTIDLGDATVGTYAVVVGFPPKPSLARFQARAHACPAQHSDGTSSPCHDQVRGGTVSVTRYDGAPGGRVEGTFDVTFADGHVTGSFAAARCD
jgi:prepilin-type processing-associated H-X9-DG protein